MNSPKKIENNSKIHSIQFLRGIAAFMVVLVHLQFHVDRLYKIKFMPVWGEAGVDLFFVISGFIIWNATVNSNSNSIMFLKRRAIRILPLYWMATALYCLLMIALPSSGNRDRLDLSYIISSFLFIPHVDPTNGAVQPILSQGWTLNFEIYFYFVFSIIVIFTVNVRKYAIFAWSAVLIFANIFLRNGNIYLNFYTSPIIIEFSLGILISIFVQNERYITKTLLIPAAGLFFCSIIIPDDMISEQNRIIFWGLPAALLLYSAVSYEKMFGITGSHIFELMGDSSYSIYIMHSFAINFTEIIWKKFFNISLLSEISYGVVSVLCALLMGWICFRFFERPAMRILTRWLIPKKV